MHFIEDNLIGVRDAPESCDERKRGDDCDCNLVIPFWLLLTRLVGLGLLEEIGGLFRDDLCRRWSWGCRALLAVFCSALPHAGGGRHGVSIWTHCQYEAPSCIAEAAGYSPRTDNPKER